jgi:hypothetical protein
VSPPYRAVIECGPTERFEVDNVATPLALSADEPRVLLPSRNALKIALMVSFGIAGLAKTELTRRER